MPASQSAAPSLSLVIPAYNEASRLPPTLQAIARYLPVSPFGSAEVIVVDDGSADETSDAAASQRPQLEASGIALRLLRNDPNRGKGHSVRRGMLAARHEWVLFCDADQSAPIGEVEKLLQSAMDGGHEVAIGSRALDRGLIGKRQPAYRELIGRAFNLNVRLITGIQLADTQCGFKLFTRRVARQVASWQRIERFGFDVEQLFLARKMGFSVVEVPVLWNDAEGSSVGIVAGISAFAEVWKVRWTDLRGGYG